MTHARFRSGVAVVAGSERPAAAPGSGGRSLGRVAASGSAASGSTPPSAGPRWARTRRRGALTRGGKPGRCGRVCVRACGRGGGREAARAAGAEVGGRSSGRRGEYLAGLGCPEAGRGFRGDAREPHAAEPFSKPSLLKEARPSQHCLLGRTSIRQTFGLESGKISWWASVLCRFWAPRFLP